MLGGRVRLRGMIRKASSSRGEMATASRTFATRPDTEACKVTTALVSAFTESSSAPARKIAELHDGQGQFKKALPQAPTHSTKG